MGSLKKIFFSFTRKEKILFLSAAAAAAVSLAVLLGILIEHTTAVVPAAGGEYAEGVVGQPMYVNPVLASSTDKLLIPLLFANVPDLADAVEMERDGKAWRVHLKEGLVWSDDVKLTSDDILFTVKSIQDPLSQSPLALSWQGVSAERVSELEVRFKLSAPYPYFQNNLDHLYVLPQHLFGETPPANWRLSEYNLKPVGSGPYVFDSADTQRDGFISAYRLKQNPAYAGRKPYVRNVVIRFFSSPNDMIKEFNSGSIDGFGSLDPELLGGINRSYKTVAYPLPSYYAVFLNQSQNPVLSDPVVRKALSDSADRARMVRDIFQDEASPAYGPVALDAPSSTPSLESIAASLDKAGWKLGEDGIRAKSTGKRSSVPLRLVLTLPQIPFLTATAEELKNDWTRLGAGVELRILSPQDALQAMANRDYQTLLYGNIQNPAGDLYAFWHSSERFYPGLNLALYSNKKADQLLESIRRELDPQKRAQKLSDLAALIGADRPAIFLYSPAYIFVMSKGVNGAEPRALTEPSDRLRQAPEWYVRTARSLK